MIVAFTPLHILLCDEVLLYFVLHVQIILSLNLNLNQEGHPTTIEGSRDGTNPSCASGRSRRFSTSSLPSETETWEG
jgi:hypothetical protein